MTYIKNDNIEAKEMYILLSLIFTYLFWIYKRNLKGENLVLGNTQPIYWDLSIHTTLTTIKLLVELNKLLYKTAGVNISLNKDIIDLIEKISSGNKELLSAIIFTSKGILLRKECDSGPMRYKSFKFQNKKMDTIIIIIVLRHPVL